VVGFLLAGLIENYKTAFSNIPNVPLLEKWIDLGQLRHICDNLPAKLKRLFS